MTKNRTPTPVYLDPGLEVKGLIQSKCLITSHWLTYNNNLLLLNACSLDQEFIISCLDSYLGKSSFTVLIWDIHVNSAGNLESKLVFVLGHERREKSEHITK